MRVAFQQRKCLLDIVERESWTPHRRHRLLEWVRLDVAMCEASTYESIYGQPSREDGESPADVLRECPDSVSDCRVPDALLL